MNSNNEKYDEATTPHGMFQAVVDLACLLIFTPGGPTFAFPRRATISAQIPLPAIPLVILNYVGTMKKRTA